MRKVYLLVFLFQFFKISSVDAQYFGSTRITVDHAKNYTLFSGFQNAILFNDSAIHAYSGGYYPWRRQFLAKCDSDRNLLWSRVFGDMWFSGNQDVQLASDKSGNTYFACMLSSYLWIEDTVLVLGAGGYDSAQLLLVKYDPLGSVAWYRKSTVVPLTDSKIGLGVDSSDNVFVSYNFYPSVTFGPDTLRESLTYNGTFIAKFDSAGNEQWLTGLSGSKRNLDFCVSRSGTSHIAGSASSLQGFGPITFTIPGGSVPSLSVCDASGIPYWQANFTGTANVHNAVGIGPNERPVVAGKFYDSVGFASLPPFSTVDSASFIASYNKDGTERWAKHAEGVDFFDVGVTSGNDIFLVGNITHPMVTIDTFHLAVSGAHGTVARLDSNGDYTCNFNFSNFSVEASSIGPGDEFVICGRKSPIWGWSYPYQLPVFAGDTMLAASDACLFVVSIGANCELRRIDSFTNFLLPEEKVRDQSAKSKIIVYPNPVSGKLNVQIKTQLLSTGTLVIRNQEGKVLHSQSLKSQNEQVDVGSLPPGLYTLEYLNGTEKVVEKFIKR